MQTCVILHTQFIISGGVNVHIVSSVKQCKAEKDEKKGNAKITLGFKGTDEFLELKQSITDRKNVVALFNDRLKKLSQVIKDDLHLQRETLNVIKAAYQHNEIVNNFMECLKKLGFDEKHCINTEKFETVSDPEKNARAKEILSDAGLLDHPMIYKANKLHWLHDKLMLDVDSIDDISSLSLYKMLEAYPAGTMLKDNNGHYWVRRARAAITRHRFITVDDQENYYMQKYLLKVPLTQNNDVVVYPPSSWIQAAMHANLVDQQHDVRANLMDAVKRGFNFESIQSLVKLYLEHDFLDEVEADAFLSTLPVGTDTKEELREVTDQLFGNGEGDDILLPPQSKPLDEYYSTFTESQRRAYEWVKGNIGVQQTQILAAIIGAAGCGKSYVMGAIVTYLRSCNLVVTKLAPSGVAASLIKGTTIHNFFKLDITGTSSLENGTVDAALIKKTDVIIMDEFAMIDARIFTIIEQLCRKYTTKDGRYKAWGGRHVILFGDPAQLPPVSNTDIFNTKLWFNFKLLQLKEIVRAKDSNLISVLLKIREGVCDEQVDSVLKSRLVKPNIASVDLTKTVIICSRCKEVDAINDQCLQRISGKEYKLEATDTDSNGQPLRENDRKRLQHIQTRLPDVVVLKEGCRIVLRRNMNISEGWVNGTLCEILNVTPNCILVCKLGCPNDRYPIPKTKQKIDIKGASYSILRSQFPVQLSYAVTVHRVQGLTVDKAIVVLNNNFFASGQAYVALSRVRNLQDLILWDYDPNAIKLAPYYSDLLKWCDSVDVIRVPPYSGEPVKYPTREVDPDISENLHVLLVDELLDCETMVTSPSSTNFNKSLQHDCIDGKFGTVRPANDRHRNDNVKNNTKKRKITTMHSGKSKPTKKMRTDRINRTKVIAKTAKCTKAKSNGKSTRTTICRVSGKIKSSKKNDYCEIINTESAYIRGPNRTAWPEYRYHQVDSTWQTNACSRMGLQFRQRFQCQIGGTDVILTCPNSATLHNVAGDGNCLFRAFSYVITGSEHQHIEIRNALVNYMLSIENYLVGYGDDGNYNYLQPFGHTTVQNYIDSRHLDRPNTWGSELEMMCLSHMLDTVVYSFGAQNNNWEVFAYNFVDRSLTCDYTQKSIYLWFENDYTQKSIYLWFENSHFKVVTSIM